jgi:hypothetical protein
MSRQTATNRCEVVDVLIAPSLDPDGVAARAVERSAGSMSVRLATIEDLVRNASRTDRRTLPSTRDDGDGFTYVVTDEMLRRFATSTRTAPRMARRDAHVFVGIGYTRDTCTMATRA